MKPMTKLQLEVAIGKEFQVFKKGVASRHDLSDFFFYVNEFLNREKRKGARKDVLDMLDEVVARHGCPGMHPMPGRDWRNQHRSSVFPEMRSMSLKAHRDYRDMDGRWVISGHILENGKPMQINWDAVEGLDESLRREYAEAFRESLTMDLKDEDRA